MNASDRCTSKAKRIMNWWSKANNPCNFKAEIFPEDKVTLQITLDTMGYKIRLTFVYSQSFLLRFLQYYPLQLPKAAIFPPRDANCKRSNRRIQSLPFCF